jgi:epsilon-lactone hydrolase
MGDSAGGGLSLSMLLNLRQMGLPQPLTAALFSPWVDLSMSGESITTKEAEEPLLPVSIARQWASWYVGDMEATNPMISPIFADLNDLCPMLVHVGTSEILLSDSISLQKAAENTNTQLELLVWEEMFHVWHMAWRTVPEAQKAIMEVVAYLQRQIDMQLRRAAQLADKE